MHARAAYAIRELNACGAFLHTDAFLGLLKVLKSYAGVSGLNYFKSLSQENVFHDKQTEIEWMAGGWQLLQRVHGAVNDMDMYWELAGANSRRDFLWRKTEQLQSLSWEELPSYWALIAEELTGHWVNVLQTEAKQVKEWLRLECVFPKQALKSGQRSLVLEINNPTGVVARKLAVQAEESPGISWPVSEARLR
ncbi:MAG: hypothetical protein GY862_22385, partial [Gammaproteobacteria bacterium]|nr:hypothetical protein [Gammaproteobacteria bacterium]